MSSERGDGKRIARVEREIREIVANYLISYFQGSQKGLITVTRVWVSKDLRLARIYITFFSTDESAPKNVNQLVIEELQESATDFQAEIGSLLKMRYTPKLEFFIDEGLEEGLKISGIIRKLEEERKKQDSE